MTWYGSDLMNFVFFFAITSCLFAYADWAEDHHVATNFMIPIYLEMPEGRLLEGAVPY